jgi:hypothetical protein
MSLGTMASNCLAHRWAAFGTRHLRNDFFWKLYGLTGEPSTRHEISGLAVAMNFHILLYLISIYSFAGIA